MVLPVCFVAPKRGVPSSPLVSPCSAADGRGDFEQLGLGVG